MPAPREFEIIERFFTRPPTDAAVRIGIGDDAAVVEATGSIAVAVDTLVAGTHFPQVIEARALGHRSLAVNLSDLAAVGAKPRWATLALSLPQVDRVFLEDFATGFFDLADRYSVSLIGGDTTRGPLSVTVQVIGDQGTEPMLRCGGCVGDHVFVSGSLGAAAAALDYLDLDADQRSGAASAVIEHFGYPEPRVELGLALSGIAHAAIDISDGLVADLGQLCAQSKCGAVIDLEALPISEHLQSLYPGENGQRLALHGGDDYELCFAVAPADADRAREAAVSVGTPITLIGELTGEPGISGRSDGTRVVLEPEGFIHFE